MSDIFKINGKIIKVIPGGDYMVKLENGHVLKAHVSGKIRMNHIRILAGDYVTVEMSTYDLTHGRITYRHFKKPAPIEEQKTENNQ